MSDTMDKLMEKLESRNFKGKDLDDLVHRIIDVKGVYKYMVISFIDPTSSTLFDFVNYLRGEGWSVDLNDNEDFIELDYFRIPLYMKKQVQQTLWDEYQKKLNNKKSAQ